MMRPLPLVLFGLLPTIATAQGGQPLSAERQAYAEWLRSSPVSPFAALAMQRLEGPVTLGPDTADVPLQGFGAATVLRKGAAVSLTRAGQAARALPNGRPVPVPPWTFQVLGSGSSTVLLVYGKPKGTPPGWYPDASRLVYSAQMEPPAREERRRVLTLDGIDVEAEVAGFVPLRLADSTVRLQVMRMPVPGTEERELQIYFRDATNGRGTYPAGRFVEVHPMGHGTVRVDFNEARNPFCAYSSVYPCPVPWAGNALPVAIEAGERYAPAKP